MAGNRKLPTYHMLVIVGSILLDNQGSRYGREIMDLMTFKSGTIYPLLKSMVALGILTSQKEVGNKKELGRPLRTLYRLTEKGKRFGERYNARVLASNPPLVPFEEFK